MSFEKKYRLISLINKINTNESYIIKKITSSIFDKVLDADCDCYFIDWEPLLNEKKQNKKNETVKYFEQDLL